MSQDGFIEFNMGENDENVGKRTKRFSAEAGRTYRVTFVSFSKYDEATGLPTEDASVKFAGCDRIYIKGVGNVIVDATNAAAMAEFGTAKQAVASIICVWPTDKEGDLDEASYTAGKGWSLHPWIIGADKYQTIRTGHKKFSLRNYDLSLTCTDSGFQKMTFTPESECLLTKYLASGKPRFEAVGKKIVADARAMAANLQGELARRLTPQQIREALGGAATNASGNANAGGHASKDVDDLLADVV